MDDTTAAASSECLRSEAAKSKLHLRKMRELDVQLERMRAFRMLPGEQLRPIDLFAGLPIKPSPVVLSCPVLRNEPSTRKTTSTGVKTSIELAKTGTTGTVRENNEGESLAALRNRRALRRMRKDSLGDDGRPVAAKGTTHPVLNLGHSIHLLPARQICSSGICRRLRGRIPEADHQLAMRSLVKGILVLTRCVDMNPRFIPLTGETKNSMELGLALEGSRHGSSRSPSASPEMENFGFRAEVVNYAWNLDEKGTWPDAIGRRSVNHWEGKN
jgi:PAS domain-containing protein